MTWVLMLVMALFASAAAGPLVFSSPYAAAPFASPYAASYAAPLSSPYAVSYAAPYTSAALVAPTGPVLAPAGPVVAPAPAVPAAVPLSSVSAYSYGSSYSVQDYAPLINTAAAPLYSSAYTLPYNYADWFYGR